MKEVEIESFYLLNLDGFQLKLHYNISLFFIFFQAGLIRINNA